MTVTYVVQGRSPENFDGINRVPGKTFAECETLEEARSAKKQHELLQTGYLDEGERWDVLILEETRDGAKTTYRLMT